VAPTLGTGVSQAEQVLADAERFGLDLAGVTRDLVEDGVRQFSDAADALLAAVALKRNAVLGSRLNAVQYDLPAPLAQAVEKRIDSARREGWARRLWAGDASLWSGADEAKWLGWLAAAQGRQVDAGAVAQLLKAVRSEGYTQAVLLGMGGSSLGPEVLALTLGAATNGLRLQVLDSSDPAQIAQVAAHSEIAHTLFLVSSKSGATLEPEILDAYFWEQTVAAVGAEHAGQHFVAITDPGSKLEAHAREAGFRAVFHGDPSIGGRYSVLSVFGMVPLGLLGRDIEAFFAATQPMVYACDAGAPPAVNPGVYLGAVLGEAVKAGRDKVTILAAPQVASFGGWLEQLLAESTGKQGRGIVPVDLEPAAAPEAYGQDRVFVYLRTAGDAPAELDRQVEALAQAGHPVVRITLESAALIGQEFVRWEVATAIAGAVIGINPFDQPDVEASKLKTRALTDAYEKSGTLAPETPFAQDGVLAFYGDEALRGDGSAQGVLAAHWARLRADDYAAVLAYVERNQAHSAVLTRLRAQLRDHLKVATVGGFGPRFLHSTGQAYKGGPNTGVFLQITADPAHDLPVPQRAITFGVVQAAQARGDLSVLAERGRRYLRVHIKGGDIDAGLQQIAAACAAGLR
jgi:transaldolase/glucose-6-phosphate isomerase